MREQRELAIRLWVQGDYWIQGDYWTVDVSGPGGNMNVSSTNLVSVIASGAKWAENALKEAAKDMRPVTYGEFYVGDG